MWTTQINCSALWPALSYLCSFRRKTKNRFVMFRPSHFLCANLSRRADTDSWVELNICTLTRSPLRDTGFGCAWSFWISCGKNWQLKPPDHEMAGVTPFPDWTMLGWFPCISSKQHAAIREDWLVPAYEQLLRNIWKWPHEKEIQELIVRKGWCSDSRGALCMVADVVALKRDSQEYVKVFLWAKIRLWFSFQVWSFP